MALLDNPAAQLLDVIARARTKSPGERAIIAWAEVFFLNAERDAAGLLRCAARVTELVVETRRRIELLEDHDPETLLEHYGQVEAIASNFPSMAQINIGQFLSPLDAAGLFGLKVCSATLHRWDWQPVLDRSVSDSLLEQVRSLIDQIRRANDIQADVRQFLLRHLSAVEDALVHIDLGGIEALARETDAFIGAAERAGVFQRMARNKVTKALVTLITALDLSLNVTANYQSITAQPDQAPPLVVSVSVRDIQDRAGISIKAEDVELPALEARPSARGTADGSVIDHK